MQTSFTTDGIYEQISWESARSLMHLFSCKYFSSPCGLPGSGFTVVNECGKAHEPEYPLSIPILFGPYATSGEGWGKRSNEQMNNKHTSGGTAPQDENRDSASRETGRMGGGFGGSDWTVGKE